MKSNFDNALAVDHLPVVYQNPYKSVHCTAKLFHDYPQLAYHVRKIWFNGIYSSDTVSNVFAILKNCINLRTVTVPWTALRYGGSQEWGNVLSFPRLTSLELLAVPLKGQVCAMPNMHIDSEVLLGQDSSPLDFRNLRRLKIFGDSNLKPINDDDLILMAKTATNLEEILITNVSTVTIRGVTALVSASRNSLKLLEFIPLAEGGFEPPLDPTNNSSSLSSSNGSDEDMHICSLLASCPHLNDLAVTLPCACPELFRNPRVHWDETVRVRVGSGIIMGRDVEDLAALLESARTLLEQKRKDGNKLRDIEIAVGPYIFETKARLVHGNYKEAKMMSDDMRWQPVEISSVKGPYGYTGLYGGGLKGEWTAILECDFLEAVAAGLVHLDS